MRKIPSSADWRSLDTIERDLARTKATLARLDNWLGQYDSLAARTQADIERYRAMASTPRKQAQVMLTTAIAFFVLAQVIYFLILFGV